MILRSARHSPPLGRYAADNGRRLLADEPLQDVVADFGELADHLVG